VRDRQLWLMPNPGQAGRHRVATVALKIRTTRLYTYAVPAEWLEQVRPGATVRVPHGRSGRPTEGLCLRVSDEAWDHTRRPILHAEPGPTWFSERLVELGLWSSEYYVCPPWRMFAAVLPLRARKPRMRKVRYLRTTGTPWPDQLTPRQTAVLTALASGQRPRDEILRETQVGAGTVKALCARGLLEVLVCDEPRLDPACPATAPLEPCAEDAYELTPGQRGACDRITARLAQPDGFHVFLLFGVPGSGKTEVYVRTLRAAVQAGRQAILLIPEIALATQIVQRLARRFARVAVLHSQLSPRVRADTLAAIAAGAVDVVIGTRSAVFAPFPRLGLIVVDEEQEPSFKNLAAPFYHARDVAIKRGQLEQVPVVLGTATPALETWHNAHHRPHFELLHLPERVPGAALPEVRRVEVQPTGADEGPLLASELRSELTATLAAGQQAILLYNRRGYAPYLRCARCGLLLRCTRCGQHLVYHRTEPALKCHRCGASTAVPSRCLDDTCNGPLQPAGGAIQRLEEELRGQFPTARLLRLDSDTMRRRADYETALTQFEAGAADILLGTQMVAKGLDFPRVRLVGVIEADAALALPDFRAGERVFQLVVQVVGRAGRREGSSLAIVQTAARGGDLIGHALRLDYESFASRELAGRTRFFYPPASRMARLVLADARPHQACTEAHRLAEALQKRAASIHAELRVDAAEPCVLRQLRGRLRYQIIVRGPHGGGVQQLLQAALDEREFRPRVERFVLDVDPLDVL
jgi:primosomal protein N' (replication factor Y)